MRIKQFVAYALLLLIAAGAQPAYSAYWQWSKTAATNATADPTINWSEGMAPSSINDSARAQMARTAEQRDDMSGSLTTSGTSTAYTVTSNQGMCLSPSTTPQVGQAITVTVHTTSGASPTLQVDSCSAFSLQSSGAAISAGLLVANNPYTFMFNGSAWIATNFYNNSTFSVPLGALIFSVSVNPPNSNFLRADGSCISQTTYASLYALMGSPGVGTCSAGNFNAPDVRGRVIAGLDNMGTGAASRMTSSASGCGTSMTAEGAVCANGTESRTLAAANIPTISSSGSASVATSGGEFFPTTVGTNWGGPTQINLGVSSNVPIMNASVNNRNALSGSASVTSTGTNGTAFSTIQPTVGYSVYVRAL